MRDNTFAFAACETLHFIGLSLLFGSLFMVDMRGLGLFKRMPIIELHKLIPIAVFGFTINLVTGVGFLAYDASAYLDNRAFVTKMILVLAAGLNAILYEFLAFRPIVAGRPGAESGAVLRISSGLSLALWIGVLIFGRLIPYL